MPGSGFGLGIQRALNTQGEKTRKRTPRPEANETGGKNAGAKFKFNRDDAGVALLLLALFIILR